MVGRPRRNLPAWSADDQSEEPICDMSKQGSCFVIAIVMRQHSLKIQGSVQSLGPSSREFEVHVGPAAELRSAWTAQLTFEDHKSELMQRKLSSGPTSKNAALKRP